jgi:hypothetical protein
MLQRLVFVRSSLPKPRIGISLFQRAPCQQDPRLPKVSSPASLSCEVGYVWKDTRHDRLHLTTSRLILWMRILSRLYWASPNYAPQKRLSSTLFSRCWISNDGRHGRALYRAKAEVIYIDSAESRRETSITSHSKSFRVFARLNTRMWSWGRRTIRVCFRAHHDPSQPSLSCVLDEEHHRKTACPNASQCEWSN